MFFLPMRHHIWTEGIYINLLDFLHPFALFEILSLTKNGNSCQEAKFSIVHFHFNHATAEPKQGLGFQTRCLVVFFWKRMVIGENDGICLWIIPEKVNWRNILVLWVLIERLLSWLLLIMISYVSLSYLKKITHFFKAFNFIHFQNA